MKWVARQLVEVFEHADSTVLPEGELVQSVDAREGEINVGLRMLAREDVIAIRELPWGTWYHYHSPERTKEVL